MKRIKARRSSRIVLLIIITSIVLLTVYTDILSIRTDKLPIRILLTIFWLAGFAVSVPSEDGLDPSVDSQV